MLGIWVGQFFASTPLPLQSSFRKRHFWKLGTSAGLQKIRNLPKWTYCLKYDGLRQSISNIEPIQPGIIGRIFVSPIFLLKFFLKKSSINWEIFLWNYKLHFKKWNEMILVVSLMWCVFLIWLRKCQELKMNHIMLAQNLKWICCFL